jgi:hypothetical protein
LSGRRAKTGLDFRRAGSQESGRLELKASVATKITRKPAAKAMSMHIARRIDAIGLAHGTLHQFSAPTAARKDDTHVATLSRRRLAISSGDGAV